MGGNLTNQPNTVLLYASKVPSDSVWILSFYANLNEVNVLSMDSSNDLLNYGYTERLFRMLHAIKVYNEVLAY